MTTKLSLVADDTDPTPINEFRDVYYFLSNFYPAECRIPCIGPDDPKDDLIYPTSEHAYQAAKTLNIQERTFICLRPTPAIAKAEGKKLPLIPNWNNRKLLVMRSILRVKFTNPHLQLMLLKTGNRPLIEGNNWGDTFWGQVNNVGENHLGRILMTLREEFRLNAVLWG